MSVKARPAIERMLARKVVIDGHWIWPGATTQTEPNYGRVRNTEGSELVHIISYQHFVGPVPDGHEVDHLCRVGLCWRPDHLEAVTPFENKLRSEQLGFRTLRLGRCQREHELTTDNVIIRMRKSGTKHVACRTCINDSQRRRYAAKAVA